jgi:hypothetical protein
MNGARSISLAILIAVAACRGDRATGPIEPPPITGCCRVTWHPRAVGLDTLAWIPCAQTAFPSVTIVERIPCACDSLPLSLLTTNNR